MFGILNWFESSESIEATKKLDDAVSAHQENVTNGIKKINEIHKKSVSALAAAEECLQTVNKLEEKANKQ